ncbi:uncharacterized protein FIBRA_01721 [Fibroporia radiculosa]|uniref:Peptidase C14 caspase domain-containing protein n=1 Tax=Fibroporia radiculosa TaxID=599839 RepID=J4GL52_9APHY|nr:uncharacterized protein FIBRA_01721 [Fibroporia radiculosa]CCL99700.1 predicted protein [Fibroporia radiculosa]
MATKLSGVFTITNTFHSNRVAMVNDNDAEPLFCIVPLLDQVPKAELWRLIPGTAGRHQLQNMGFKDPQFARPSHGVDPQVVVASTIKWWWFIERAEGRGSKPDTYIIRQYDKRDLCWHLSDERHETPIDLLSDSGDRRNIWEILPHADLETDARTNSEQLICDESIPPSSTALSKSLSDSLANVKPAIDANRDINASILLALYILKHLSEVGHQSIIYRGLETHGHWTDDSCSSLSSSSTFGPVRTCSGEYSVAKASITHCEEALLYLTNPHCDRPHPRLFALIIGIDKYKSTSIADLSGAVRDADAVRDYLQEQLGVPESQIRNLRDSRATRSAILRGFHIFLDDERIQKGDPILIYYAGHYATSTGPADGGAAETKIQSLVPYDLSSLGPKSRKVHGIPHRTLDALLIQLAAEKGDNICVISDSCHSGSSTFAGNGEPTHLDGRIEVEAIPSDLDEDILSRFQPEEVATATVTTLSCSGLRCQVLLVTDGAQRHAMETGKRERFAKTPIDAAVEDEMPKFPDAVQRMPSLHAGVQPSHRETVRGLLIKEQRSTRGTKSKTGNAKIDEAAHDKRQQEVDRGRRREGEQEILAPVLDQGIDLADMNRLILMHEHAVRTTPDGDPNKPFRLNNLGCSLLTRFMRLGSLEDIRRSISMLEDAVRLSPDGDPEKPSRLSNLKSSQSALERLENIDRPISRRKGAVRLSLGDGPAKPHRLMETQSSRPEIVRDLSNNEHRSTKPELSVEEGNDMAHDKRQRKARRGKQRVKEQDVLAPVLDRGIDLADMNRSIMMQEHAVRSIVDGDPSKPFHLNNLGRSLLTRFMRLGSLEDIHRSISMLEDAIRLSLDGDPNKPSRLDNLGRSQSALKQLGNFKDIDRATSRHKYAVRLSPDGGSDKPHRSMQVQSSYLETGYEPSTNERKSTESDNSDEEGNTESENSDEGGNTESESDRERSRESDISVKEIEETARGRRQQKAGRGKQRAEEQETLAPVLDQSIDLADMNRSIMMQEHVVRSTSDNDRNKLVCLNNLGRSLLTRFMRLGSLEDIHRSISMLEDVVQLSPDGDPNKPSRLDNLGCSLLARFARLGSLEDIHKSISMHEDAVQLSSDEDPDKPSRLDHLGCSLLARFERLGNLKDIHRSISMHKHAERLTPDDDPHKLIYSNNFKRSLSILEGHQKRRQKR